jgi:ADP-ribosylglycohydrolase
MRENDKRRIEKTLEAFAVGDAMGLPTEFMTKIEIARKYRSISTLLDPRFSALHPDLPIGSISDDTEQNIYLINSYYHNGISTESTVKGLLEWIEASDAVARKFIGPSSLKSLRAIQEGKKPEEAGYGNTTCGAVMRVLSVVLCSSSDSLEELERNIYLTTLPTHNSESALEAALALGFAFNAAMKGSPIEEVKRAFFEGAKRSGKFGSPIYATPSTASRVSFYLDNPQVFPTRSSVENYLAAVQGTGLYANEVAPSAFILFLSAPNDSWGNICTASGLGGDTDTIAAISGALSALYSGFHNIPARVVETVLSVNHLSFRDVEEKIASFH